LSSLGLLPRLLQFRVHTNFNHKDLVLQAGKFSPINKDMVIQSVYKELLKLF
jgi:hypothetical protein